MPQMHRAIRLSSPRAVNVTYKTPSICFQCRAALGCRPQHAFQSRNLSNTKPRRAESLKRETHYEFFPGTVPEGPPPRGPFQIDLRQLKREFLQMQADAHPDHHPKELKGRAEALSARINEAYKTLQDPLLRAQYILSLKGIDVAEDETAKVEDQELLIQVLESQETIEEAEKDEQLQDLTEENNKRLEESVKVLEQAFADDDIETAKQEAVRLRYWVNIRDSIGSWEPGKPVTLVH